MAARMCRIFFIGLLPWLATCATPAHATEKRWDDMTETIFQHITAENGLPKSFYTALAEDGDGFIWIGTADGLARWDGYRARIFRPHPNDPCALPSHFIQTLFTDRSKRLWVGTTSGGLARYDRERECFVTIASGPNAANGLSNIAINAISDDDEGGIWVATDSGVDHINPATGGIEHLRHNVGKADTASSDRATALMLARDKTLWIGTEHGVVLRAPNGTDFQHLALPGVTQSSNVTSFLQTKDGRIWIGTAKTGSFLYDPKTKGIRAIPAIREDGVPGNHTSTEWITGITEARPGEIWLSTFGQGIIAIDSTTMRMHRIVHDSLISASLDDNAVWAMMRDRSGLVWVGTISGVNHSAPQQTAVLTIFAKNSRPTNLSDSNVRAIMVGADGRFWFGLGANGVDIVNPRNKNPDGTAAKRIQTLHIDPDRPDTALQKGRIHTIQTASNGLVYLGTDQGLYRADQSGLHIERMNTSENLTTANVNTLLQDRDRLLVGNANGLWTHDLAHNAILPEGHPRGTEQLTDQRVTTLAHGAEGTIWVGTRNGLNLLNTTTHTVERIMPDSNDPHALAAGFISALLTDRQGRLWVGTSGGGINILEGRDANGKPRFRQIGIAEGLPSPHIDTLLSDHQGNIWASTDDGLAMINTATFALRALRRADGVFIDTYWASSGAVTRQGEVMFGGRGGISVVRPSAIQEWNYRPPLVITDIRLGSKEIAVVRMSRNPNGSPGNRVLEPLAIAANANSLAVEFSALDYSAPERNQYSYRLDGYDSDWLHSDASRRLASYTNLPPGDYLLRVRGSNRNGVWAKQDLTLAITVLPAWYQTWWFHLLAVLTALLAVFALVQVRTRFLRQGQRRLERQVTQRTHELEQNQNALITLNQDLNHANTELARSAETLQELGDVGRNITANLDLEAAFEALHLHMGHLLDAPRLVIYRCKPDATTLELSYGREHGQILPRVSIPLDSARSNAARTARERAEVLYELADEITDNAQQSQQSQSALFGRQMRTALYAPLIVDQRLLGVITIQSARQNAYGERERLIFRTLCAYGAIALDNANAYRQLQQTQAKLVEQEKLAALGSMVAGVAHELNTPIGNSLLMLSSMQSRTNEFSTKINGAGLLRSDLLEYLNDAEEASTVILRGLTSAADLVSSFKQVAVDRTSAQRRRFDLQHTSREIIATLMNQVKLSGHTITLDIPNGIVLNSYPGPYGQVLANLIDNALLHAFKPGISGQIHIGATRESNETVTIAFADNGDGIDPEHIKRVFDPFFTTKMGQGCIGLGLSVSYNIVTSLLHGEIRADSAPSGTCFTLSLPLTAPEVESNAS
jgi:ligand-binding sensor domain-containing protein/signal transduction histidine kinase